MRSLGNARERLVRLGAALVCVFGLACSEPRVLVVGLDGANWKVLDPLVDAGLLPNIGRLVREGASAELDCVPADPPTRCFCPPVWTSIATGVPFEDHRIGGLYTPSSARRVKAIWNVAAEHGVVVTTSSWRGTWPPEPGVEFVFTEPGLDAAAGELFDVWPSGSPAQDDLLFQPPDLLELLGVLPAPAPAGPSWAIFARDRAAMVSLNELAERRRILEAEEEFWERRADLTMIIVHGPDKVAHVSWNVVQQEMYGPFDADRLVADAKLWTGPVMAPGPFGFGTIAAPYLEADQWLGELLAIRPYDYVVFVSDHGMTRNPQRGISGHHNPPATEAHHGIFAIWGAGVRSGARLDEVSVLDVAPTLAYLLGLPIAEDRPGRVVAEAFEPDWLTWTPTSANTTPSWD